MGFLDSQYAFEEETLLADVLEQDIAELIVYNDDYNTFDHVIQCFMDILHHTLVQSEQLSIMIHNNGKASVKRGTFKMLKPLKEALIDKGLSAVIEHSINR